MAPSISSAGDPRELEPDDPEGALDRLILEGDQALRAPNPHLKYIPAQLNGYLLVEANRERLRAEYWLVPRVGEPTDEQALDRAFTVRRGAARLAEGEGPLIDTSGNADAGQGAQDDRGGGADRDREDRDADRDGRDRRDRRSRDERGAADTSDPAGFTEARRDASAFTG